jgi:YfiH family protein
MQLTKKGKIHYLASGLLDRAGLSAQGFTTRHEGVSRAPYNSLNLGLTTLAAPSSVEGNRSLLARAFGTHVNRLLTVNQVHGADILVIDTPNPDYSHFLRLDCDGIITNQPGVMIGVGVADCVPVLLFDPVKRAVAALHAGWKGTAQRICEKGVESLMTLFGSQPADILAAIGPAIGSCCYEVDAPVRAAFACSDADWSTFARPAGSDRWQLNLKEANRLQLLGRGIPESRIEVAGHCVSCSPELFFSYRRDQGETGRQFGFIMLAEE